MSSFSIDTKDVLTYWRVRTAGRKRGCHCVLKWSVVYNLQPHQPTNNQSLSLTQTTAICCARSNILSHLDLSSYSNEWVLGQEESVCVMWQPALAEDCCETAVTATRRVLLLISRGGGWILFKAFYKLKTRFPTYLTVLLWSADRQRFLSVFQGCLLFACCQGSTRFFPPATDRLYFRCSGCQQSGVMEQKHSGLTRAVSHIDTFLKSSSRPLWVFMDTNWPLSFRENDCFVFSFCSKLWWTLSLCLCL